MCKHSTDFERLQALRREVREACEPARERERQTALTSNRPAAFIEDLITTRLIEIEADLFVAVGLYRELAADASSPLLKYGRKLSDALDTVQDAVHLENSGLYE